MKLNRKFSFIILFTIVQSCVLTVFSIINLKSIQNIKDYQNMETKTEAQLSTIIDYLERMDYWDFDIGNAYSAFEEKKVEISKSFAYLTENPIVNEFPEDFTNNLKQVKLTWQLIEDGLNPIEDILRTMETVKINAGALSNIKNYGIRESAKLYTSDAVVQNLLSMTEEAHQQLRKIRLLYVQLMSLNQKSSVMIDEVMNSMESRFISIAIIFAVITTIVLSILILIVTTRVSKRIVKVRNITTTLAEKDFTVSMNPEGSDEMWLLMSNINNMVNQINGFFKLVKSTALKALLAESSINESAGRTAEASSMIDTNIDDINKKFSEAVSVINSTIAVIAEMNLHVDTLVQSNSSQTAAIENSNSAVNEVVTTLDYIRKMAEERVRNAEEMHTYVADGDDKISATNEILNKVAQQLDEVYEVVTIINNVAEQTNLLSMNAAIEAAHAGEFGAGFAVVADEVRSLASSSSSSARDIQSKIKEMMEKTSAGVEAITSAGTAFQGIRDNVIENAALVKNIYDAMIEQNEGAAETKEAADNLVEAIHAIRDLAEEETEEAGKLRESMDAVVAASKSTMSAVQESLEATANMKNTVQLVESSAVGNKESVEKIHNHVEQFIV